MKKVLGALVLCLGLVSCAGSSKHAQGECVGITGKPMVALIDKVLYEKDGMVSFKPSLYILKVALVLGPDAVLPVGVQAAEVGPLDSEPGVESVECPAALKQ